MIVPYVFSRSGFDSGSDSGSVHSASTGFFGLSCGTGTVEYSGSVGLTGISDSVGVSAGSVVSGSSGLVDVSVSVGSTGLSGVFLRSVISILIKLPSFGTVNRIASAVSYPSGADISVRI